MLKIGELARRAGLTVRTLHHYDSIGLLAPHARSDAGYRLYREQDLERLQQIQALQRYGVSLAEIGHFMADPGASLAHIVDQQLATLRRQVAQASALCAQLDALKLALASGSAAPDLATWLTTLEYMKMIESYFSKEEMQRLPFLDENNAASAIWAARVAHLRKLMEAGVPPSAPQAMAAAEEWMRMLEHDTGCDPGLVVRVLAMQAKEPAMRAQNGITPELEAYLNEAFTLWRISLMQPYLNAAELAYTQAHYRDRASEWPQLIARVKAQWESGAQTHDAAVQALMMEWIGLAHSMHGTDPATHLKLRQAFVQEPRLMTGSFMKPELLQFVGAAMAALPVRI